MWSRILNFVGFQLGWLACVAGPGQGRPWIGPLVVGLFLSLHLLMTPSRRREGMLALMLAAIGTATESLHLGFGVFQTPPSSLAPWLCPTWLTLLWVNFAPTLHGSMSWLIGRPGWAAGLGAMGGPVSYYAAHRLGAISFPADPPTASLLVLAVVWAVAMPALLRVAVWADQRWGEKQHPRDMREKRDERDKQGKLGR
jgi:hypothetical protein